MSYQPTMNEFFQWKRHPFTDARPLSVPYLSSAEHKLIHTAKSLLSLGKSFAMAGPSGSGKTTLIQYFLNQLDSSTYHPIYLHYGGLKRSGLLRALADLMGVDPAGRQIPLLTKLQKHLQQLNKENHAPYPVIVVDDAHLMERDTLLDLCSLLVMPGNNRPASSLILIGDPSFPKLLNLHVMAPVKTRLTICFPMRSLGVEDVKALIQLRLKEAEAPSDLFEKEAIELVFAQVAGNRRELMNICTLLLEEAFSRKEKTVGTQLVHNNVWTHSGE